MTVAVWREGKEGRGIKGCEEWGWKRMRERERKRRLYRGDRRRGNGS